VWTNSGNNRDDRQLKQRARGETRTVPCPPELTEFRGERNSGELPKGTIVRAWRRARIDVYSEEVAASSLARTLYDLRHAAVSTWLNGGTPTAVAEWAGHSVEVLLKIYASAGRLPTCPAARSVGSSSTGRASVGRPTPPGTARRSAMSSRDELVTVRWPSAEEELGWI
jgi:hypothetical protein